MKYDEKTLLMVWQKAMPSLLAPLGEWAWDSEWNLINYHEHGKYTPCGWQVDHIIPQSRGGGDHLGNLQPLQWEANLAKGDSMVDDLAQVLLAGDKKGLFLHKLARQHLASKRRNAVYKLALEHLAGESRGRGFVYTLAQTRVANAERRLLLG